MRSIVVHLLVFLAIVIVAVDGGNTSTVSKIPAKLDDKTIICNVVQNSPSQEAIKSLEANLVATLEKKFEQLMETITNRTSHGKPTGKASLMLFYSGPVNFVFNPVFRFLVQAIHLLLASNSTRITSKLKLSRFHNFKHKITEKKKRKCFAAWLFSSYNVHC